MPTIKVSIITKQRLESLMAKELKQRMDKAKGQEKQELFMALIKNRYGLTFDDFINKIMDKYTHSTK